MRFADSARRHLTMPLAVTGGFGLVLEGGRIFFVYLCHGYHVDFAPGMG
jgi:hypothetical protein